MSNNSFSFNSGNFKSNISDRVPGVDYDASLKTIIPLNVEYVVELPTNGNDGSITLLINGGTKPYKINWDNGHNGDVLGNIGFGEYNVTVSDYYNDFVITKNIMIENQTLLRKVQNIETIVEKDTNQIIRDENPNLCITNGKETYTILYRGNNLWSYNDIELLYSEKNNRWEINGIGNNKIVKIDKNKTNSPFNGKWSLNGEKWKVSKGECIPIEKKLKTIVNDETCYDLKDGSVKILIDNDDYRDYEFRIRGVKPYPTFSGSNIFNKLASDKYFVEAKKGSDIISGEFIVKEGKKVNVFNVNLTKTDETNNNDNKVKDFKVSVNSGNEFNNDEVIVKLKLTHIVKYNCPSGGCIITPDFQVNIDGFNLVEESEIINPKCDNKVNEYLKSYVGFKEVSISEQNDYIGTISHTLNTFDYTWSDCECKAFVDSKVRLEIVKSYVNDGLCNKVNNMGEVISMIYLQNCIKE